MKQHKERPGFMVYYNDWDIVRQLFSAEEFFSFFNGPSLITLKAAYCRRHTQASRWKSFSITIKKRFRRMQRDMKMYVERKAKPERKLA